MSDQIIATVTNRSGAAINLTRPHSGRLVWTCTGCGKNDYAFASTTASGDDNTRAAAQKHADTCSFQAQG